MSRNFAGAGAIAKGNFMYSVRMQDTESDVRWCGKRAAKPGMVEVNDDAHILEGYLRERQPVPLLNQ